MINTLRSLYMKTYFRVKKHLSDLCNYLNEKMGVILLEDEILVNQIRADDLIMTSTTTADAQNQLIGLSSYFSKHRSIVNSVKTKFMVYGRF